MYFYWLEEAKGIMSQCRTFYSYSFNVFIICCYLNTCKILSETWKDDSYTELTDQNSTDNSLILLVPVFSLSYSISEFILPHGQRHTVQAQYVIIAIQGDSAFEQHLHVLAA